MIKKHLRTGVDGFFLVALKMMHTEQICVSNVMKDQRSGFGILVASSLMCRNKMWFKTNVLKISSWPQLISPRSCSLLTNVCPITRIKTHKMHFIQMWIRGLLRVQLPKSCQSLIKDLTLTRSSSRRFIWNACWLTPSWISAPPTGSVLSWEPSCWLPKSGMTRLCGMSTTARFLKTSLWRTCEFVSFMRTQ